MNQEERRKFLIEELLRERPSCRRQEIPADIDRQKILLRSLVNVRHPGAVSQRFLEVRDAYLQEELAAKKITRLPDLHPVQDEIYLWRGDITTLECGAIVNAANSGMTGCYRSCLKLADENNVGSIAFCCISTGVFLFPNDKAAEIAVRTVQEYKAETGSKIEVIFNVFKEQDEQIYRKLLRAD